MKSGLNCPQSYIRGMGVDQVLRVWIGVLIALGAALAACSGPADAPDLRVAVAANFLPAMAPLTAKFEADTGYDLQAVSGSTGALYTQITQGAPFDVFLAADQARPEKLAADGRTVQGLSLIHISEPTRPY